MATVVITEAGILLADRITRENGLIIAQHARNLTQQIVAQMQEQVVEKETSPEISEIER